MSRLMLSVLAFACMAMAAGVMAFTASATTPTNKAFAMLTGGQEAPGPGDGNATGAALVTAAPGAMEVCIAIRFRRIDGNLSAMHIHEARRRQPGPIVVDLTSALTNDGIACGSATTATIAGIRNNPQRFYVNVHSTPDFPGGAIRGQLADSDI